MYGSGGNSNSIDGGGGNDHITIIGHVDTSSSANNIIRGGTGGVEDDVEERDILHIDQNNMADIITLSNAGKTNEAQEEGTGNISGFETLLLDMTGNEELDLSAVLQNLTHINSSGGTPNELIIGVNQKAAMQNGEWVISGGGGDNVGSVAIDNSGLTEAASASTMQGYTAFTYQEGETASLVYIQSILLASGTE
jgi:hypothetical protein